MNIRECIFVAGLVVITVLGLYGCAKQGPTTVVEQPPVVVAFYYPWYGTPEIDGEYRHWSHDILGDVDTPHSYPGGDDIGANFYPEGGCYSSNDSLVVDRHMRQLKQAGISVVCVSWWGAGSFEDRAVPQILDAAEKHDLGVAFHLEPFEGRTAETVRCALEYLIDSYGLHPAIYRDDRFGGRPVVFAYDSYLVEPSQWASILSADSGNTIRGTSYDALVLGLCVNARDDVMLSESGFDGFYTYFVSDGFTYGSTPANWETLNASAQRMDMTFVPCVGPGYIDTRIRPWNTANTRARGNGAYYDRMFAAAARVYPPMIGVTSFNEWHEGTQIEPAGPKSIAGFTYEDYANVGADYYLNLTRQWVGILAKGQAACDSVASTLLAPEVARIDHLARECSATLSVLPDRRYDGGGPSALVDGVRGTPSYRDGHWLGFEGTDVTIVVDLAEIRKIQQVEIGFLQDPGAWIFLPQAVSVSVSSDGREYEAVLSAQEVSAGSDDEVRTASYVATPEIGDARFLRVQVRSIGVCPEWHPAAGGKAWLFVDEIAVK